jgi:hypothetical protein
MRAALVALILVSPLLADARPITIGAGLGVSHSEVDAEAGLDASRTLNLFGRLGFSRRVAGQLELSRFDTEDGSGASIRTGTAALVVDLVDGGRWVPTLLAGIGLDRSSGPFGDSQSGHHLEGGFGIEYRAEGGFTLGADLRLGGRSLDEDDVVIQNDTPVVFLAGPSRLAAGEYRSARLWLGVRF